MEIIERNYDTKTGELRLKLRNTNDYLVVTAFGVAAYDAVLAACLVARSNCYANVQAAYDTCIANADSTFLACIASADAAYDAEIANADATAAACYEDADEDYDDCVEDAEDAYDACMAEARHIVQAHWRWLQAMPTFSSYEFHSYAPMLGIRESYRVVGEYVLTQHDLLAGLRGQSHPDIIALADHKMDVHGKGSRRVDGDLKGPYGVPYRCLVPRGRTNLLVAGRCASFSHVAASSCRLSRTMMALGHAAGRLPDQVNGRLVFGQNCPLRLDQLRRHFG